MIISKKTVALPQMLEEYVVNMSEGDSDELRVLVYVLAREGEINTDEIAVSLGIDETAVVSAVSFWRGAGLISVKGKARGVGKGAESRNKTTDKTAEPITENTAAQAERLPSSVRDTDSKTYTSEEVARIIEKSEVSSLRDYLQQRLGKIMSQAEETSLARLIDYILLTPEMIMLIAEYCVENGKNSMRYVEKTAIGIYDEGIHDYEALVKYFDRKKAAKSNEGVVKRILGTGERNLTPKEKEHIEKWFDWFSDCHEELISLAYEKTIANISKPSIPYMSKLLELWHSKGYKNVRDVENGRIAEDTSRRIDLDSFDEASKKSDRADSEDAALDLDDFF